MKVEIINVDTLKPYINNARKHSADQILKIRASLREFGFVNPCLVDGDNNIIAGHGRVEAAKAEGITHVPCVRVENLSDSQKRAYILADNRLAELATWDRDTIAAELDVLNLDGFDIALTGFKPEEYSDADIDGFFESDDAEKQKSIKQVTCPYCGKTFTPQ